MPLPEPADPTARRWALVASTLGAALVILDVTAMNVVGPVIQRELQANVALLQWLLNAYTLFLASVLLLGGALADRFGRRAIFALGVALFATAALAIALSPSAGVLLAARALQGLGGALLIPAGLGLLAAHYPVEERGRAIGIWGGFSGLAAVAGPVLGGVLSDYLSWRWFFLIYLPFALFLLAVLALRVPRARRPPDPHRLDLAGAVLATLGLFGVVFAVIRSGVSGWSDPVVLATLVLGLALLAVLVRHESRARAPLLDPARLRDRDFGGAQVVTLFVYFALAAAMLFVPMRLLYLENWRPALAGAAVVPTILAIAVFSPVAGALLPRFGARPLTIAGALVAAAGYLLLALPGPGTSYWAGTFWGLLLAGLGMALLIAPVTATVLAAVPEREAARASGVNNAVSRLAALLAIAVAGVVAVAAQGVVVEDGLQDLGLDAQTADDVRSERLDYGAAEPPESVPEAQRGEVDALLRAGFLAGYRTVQLVMALSAALGALAAALLLTRAAGR